MSMVHNLQGLWFIICRVYLMRIAAQNITARLRTSVFGSIVKQEAGYFDKTKTGELVNRLSADSQLVSQAVTQQISGLFPFGSLFGSPFWTPFWIPIIQSSSYSTNLRFVSLLFSLRSLKSRYRQMIDSLVDIS